MGDAECYAVDSEDFCAFRGSAVKLDARLAGAFPGDFDFFPTDAACACTKGFHDGFFRGESGGELGRPASAVRDLARGVDTLQETFAEPFNVFSDTPYLYDVDADGYVLQSEPQESLRSVGGTRRL